MKALCWYGKNDVRVDKVPDPKILSPRDIVIKMTASAICGSDLHILNGYISHMEAGDVLGHEFMGEVVEKGSEVKNLKVGDKVVVPFTISCGECFFCKKQLFSLCDASNPNADIAKKNMGQSPAGVFGYSHMLGGFSGGQAEYIRVPFADVGPIKVNHGLRDDQVLFLSDIFPTGYMAAENCHIQRGDTIAIWGCGPVGQFAIQSAWLLGAGRVIAIDSIPERLTLAASDGKTEIIDTKECDVFETLMKMTHDRGADACIDAVGTEAHAHNIAQSALDNAREALHIPADHPYVLQEMIMCCRKGGTLSVPGVYLANVSLPFGALMNKGLTLKTGQTHVQKYLAPLLKLVEEQKIDPSFIITHKMKLKDAAKGYDIFNKKQDGCIKVFLTP